MKGALKIGVVKGIGVYIHWTFFLLLGWVAWGEFSETGLMSSVMNEILLVMSVFLCVLLHEFGHALMAAKYHVPTKDITLLPIGGVARLERMPEHPRQEFFVAIAGPAVNVGIIIVLIPVILFGKGWPIALDMIEYDSNSFVMNLLLVNLSLIVFNLIPAFPMDGGRVFRSLLAMKLSRLKATQIAVYTGQLIAIGFFIAGIYFNPMLMLIAVFVFMGAQTELKMIEKQAVYHGLNAMHFSRRDFVALSMNDSVQSGVDLLLSGRISDFVIFEEGELRTAITRDDLLRLYAVTGGEVRFGDLPLDPLVKIEGDARVDDCWKAMSDANVHLAVVVEENRLRGVLRKDDLATYIAMRSIL
jgi:Zn-dependent protease/predicted transcriptional regulator